jgi:hypothetical protein
MELLDLSHNDDTASIARKCNANFKRMWLTIKNMTNNQTRNERDETSHSINNAVNSLVNTTIPNEVSSQISSLDIPNQIRTSVANQISSLDIPNQISTEVADQIASEDIPQIVSDEIDNRMTDVYPEIGACIISNNMPSYDDTTWQQIDTITTDSSITIPIWERIA